MSTEMVSKEELARIVEVCARFGVQVSGARRRGVMLELIPVNVEDAVSCGSDQLRELADALGGDGVRYVSLSLEEEG